MECDQFREAMLVDPATTDPDLQAHEGECEPCAAFAVRARRTEALIAEALRFDVAAAKAAGAEPVAGKRWTGTVSAGLAAAVVAVVVLGLGRGFVSPAAALGGDVAEHWQHEPYSWVVTDKPVPGFALQQVVSGRAELDTESLPTISYAHLCFFRGRWVPHLVVQGEEGPVMVMLMPSESLRKPMPFELVEENLEGVVIPHGEGSIAILGAQQEDLKPLQESLSRAVEWSI